MNELMKDLTEFETAEERKAYLKSVVTLDMLRHCITPIIGNCEAVLTSIYNTWINRIEEVILLGVKTPLQVLSSMISSVIMVAMEKEVVHSD